MPVSLGSVVPEDVERMTSKLYVHGGLDSPRKRTAFWALPVLAAIIATRVTLVIGGSKDLPAG